MKRRLVLLLVLASAAAPVALAQPPATRAENPLDEVEFLLGSWQGEGRYFRGPEVPPQVVAVTEEVTSRAGGAVLLLEGRGTVPGPEGQPEIVVHEALGVLSWDPAESVYRMRAFRSGQVTDAIVEVEDRRLSWGFHDPNRGVDIRFTLTLDDQGRWSEVGEVDRGEAGLLRFFEMTLERVEARVEKDQAVRAQ